MENRDSKDKQSLVSYLKIHLVNLILMCKEHKKNLLVVIAFVAVMGAVIALGMQYDQEEISQAVNGAIASTEESTENAVIAPQETVLEEALAEDAFPEAVNLVKQYYEAMEEGDLETIAGITSNTGDKESIIIETKSRYIENYPQIKVYTKSGPDENSLIAYVYYHVKFIDQESTVPGVSPLYLCMREDGSYYINQTVSLQTKDYIDQVTVHNDVIDLYNKVQVEYNEVLTQDEGLNQFLVDLKETLMESVSLELAKLEEENQPEVTETEEEEESLPVTVVTKVKTTDVVNVRTSDSITADRIGQTTTGQVLDLVEELLNGWSKVEFEGKEGFIKSEFLIPEETMVVDAGEEDEQPAEGAEDSEESEEKTEEIKTTDGKLTDTVNIRKGPGTDKDKVGQLSKGTTIKIIEKMSNGWTKILYEDSEAYVKSDYVE